MQVGVAEFLEQVSKLRTDDEKINALKFNDSFVLRCILQGAFDPNVEWLIPPGVPPYKPTDQLDQEHMLINKAQKLQYFVKGFYDNLNSTKREMMFIEMLESVSPKDALLLVAIKDKTLPYKGITVQHVLAAFPDMMPNYVPPVEVKEEKVATKNFPAKDKVVCPHCSAEGSTMRMMTRYHFDNCKHKTAEEVSKPIVQVQEINNVQEAVKVPVDGVYQATDLSAVMFNKE